MSASSGRATRTTNADSIGRAYCSARSNGPRPNNHLVAQSHKVRRVVAGVGWFYASGVLTKVAGVATVVALAFPAVATAASAPSECSCLLAWNVASNSGNGDRVVRLGRWPSATLTPASVGTVGLNPPTNSNVRGCVLMLSRPGWQQQIVGRWVDHSVRTWIFWPAVRTSARLPRSNVRVLSDGRVTKIYDRR